MSQDPVTVPTWQTRMALYVMIGLALASAVASVVYFSVTSSGNVMGREGERGRGRALDRHFMLIAIALDNYRLDHRTYPPDTGHFLHAAERRPGRFDPASLWRHLVRPVHDARRDRMMGPYLELGDDLGGSEPRVIIDGWGNAIDVRAEPGRVIHNKGSFDIYSCGTDGVTASNNARDDDGDGRVDEPDEWRLNGDVGDDVNNWD